MAKNKGEQAPTSSATVAAQQPAYLKNTVPTMQPAGMPGQIAALAQQLGAGYGINPAAFLADLNKTYAPAPTLDFRAPPSKPKVTPKPAPKTNGKNVMIPSLGKNAR